MFKNTVSKIKMVFLHEGRLDKSLLGLFLLINLIVLFNAVVHNPRVGYDAVSNLDYAQILPTRLPTSYDETHQFFAPPLAYFLPSLANRLCIAFGGAAGSDVCIIVAGKTGQGVNFLLSLGLTLLLIKTSERLRPGDRLYKHLALGTVGILPVYYRTFAQFRGEPYVVFFSAALLYQTLKLMQERDKFRWQDSLPLGLLIGLAALSRQWAFLVFAGVAVWVLALLFKAPRTGKRLLASFSLAAVIGFALAGWFYIYLYFQHGDFTAFNRDGKPTIAFSNQPITFYRATGLQEGRLFDRPVRDNFPNWLLPMMYSDTWGDYHGFMIWSSGLQYHQGHYVQRAYEDTTYRTQIAEYLGRVNLVSLWPSAVLLGAVGYGAVRAGRFVFRKREASIDAGIAFDALSFAVFVSSLVGYFLFLLKYPDKTIGLTIKATYILQGYLMLPFFAAGLLARLGEWRRWALWVVLVGVGLAFVYNFPAMVTHFPLFGY